MLRYLFALLGPFVSCCAFAQQEPLVLFLDTPVGQPSTVLAKMKEEAASLLRPAGWEVSFRDLRSRRAGESFDQFVVVKWNGVCDGAVHQAAGDKSRLAFAHTSDGRILPFVEVECRTLNALLFGAAHDDHNWKRNMLLGRALGRVIAHEVFHVLTQRATHDAAGVGKPYFRRRDLIADSFVFEESTRAQMQKPVAASSDDALEEATGR